MCLAWVWRVRRFLPELVLQKMILAVAVEMLVDAVVFDGLAANRTLDHVDDEWTIIYATRGNATAAIGLNSEELPA